LQGSISWASSMLPGEHTDTLTSTTTGGILVSRDNFSAGIFASYIYSSMEKHADTPSRQQGNSFGISPTFTCYLTKSLYVSLTPSIAIRNVDETYIAIEIENFQMEKKRSYTALDTSFTPEIGYTIYLNDIVSVTPSVSAPFSWTQDSGLYSDYSYSSAIVPSLRAQINFNKKLSVNIGTYYQYVYNRPDSYNLDYNNKAIGRDTLTFNAGLQYFLSEKISLSLTFEHSISDRWRGDNITANISYTF